MIIGFSVYIYIVYMSTQSTNIIVNIKIINGMTLFIIYINYMKNNFLIVLIHAYTYLYSRNISMHVYIYVRVR